MLVSSSAWANGGNAAPAAEPVPGDGATAATGDTAGAGDIVVTARRRVESTLKVPVAVTVLSGQALQSERILNTLDIGTVTPGLTTVSASGGDGGQIAFTIRGQGTQYGNPNAVLIYSDEAVLGGAGGTNGVEAGPIYDLASIQVLKGPQGTLFGATSTGGAVLYTTKRAVLNSFEGYVQADMGNLNYRQLQGALNLPLTSWAAIRFSGDIYRRDGFTTMENLPGAPKFGGDRSESFRVSLHLEPVRGLTNDTIFEYYHDFNTGDVHQAVALSPQVLCGTTASSNACVQNVNSYLANRTPYQATTPNLAGAIDGGSPYGPTPAFVLAQGLLGNNIYDHPYQSERVVNLTNFDVTSGLRLRNIFSYATNKIYPISGGVNYSGYDPVTTGIPALAYTVSYFAVNTDQPKPYVVTEEVQAQAQLTHDIHLTGGGYYEKDRQITPAFGELILRNPATPALPFLSQVFGYGPVTASTYEAKALYGQADINGAMVGLDRFSLALGVRETWTTNIGAVDTPSAFTSKAHGLTYNISLNYEPTDSVLIYVAHRKGQKPGGTNPEEHLFGLPAAAQDYYRSYAPEGTKDIELGAKARFSSGGWRGNFDAAAYYTWYNDIQEHASDPLGDSIVGNFAKARIKGFEVEGSVRPPVPGLELSAYVSVVDPKYTSFQLPNLVGMDASPNQTLSYLLANFIIDGTSSPFSYTSKFSSQVRISYDLPIMSPDKGVLTISGSYFHQSSYFGAVISNGLPPGVGTAPGQDLVKARVDWRNVGGSGLDVGVFVDNITNKANVVAADASTYTSLGQYTNTYGPPRTYGMELRYAFGKSR